jgi:hypothetical protein
LLELLGAMKMLMRLKKALFSPYYGNAGLRVNHFCLVNTLRVCRWGRGVHKKTDNMRLLWTYEDFEKLGLGAVCVCYGVALIIMYWRGRKQRERFACLCWCIGHCLKEQWIPSASQNVDRQDPLEFDLAVGLSGDIKRVLEEAAAKGYEQSEVIGGLRRVMTEDVCFRLQDPGLRGQLEHWIRYEAETLCNLRLDIITLKNLWVYPRPQEENAGRSPAEGRFS